MKATPMLEIIVIGVWRGRPGSERLSATKKCGAGLVIARGTPNGKI